MSDPAFTLDTFISFGDCDPAGIVFYPNFFGLFDRTFHAWLMAHGGHVAICEAIGAKGLRAILGS